MNRNGVRMMKMIAMLSVIAMICARAEADTNNLEEVAKQIALVRESVGSQVINSFPEYEPYGLIVFNPECQKLIPMVQTSWKEALNHLPEVAPDRESRLVLLHALLFLPPNDYLQCINRLLDLYEEGKITKDEYIYLYISPPRDENEWFLAYNAKDPRVLKLLMRMKAAFPESVLVPGAVDQYINGKAKFRDRILRFQNRGLRNRTVPLLENETEDPDLVKPENQ